METTISSRMNNANIHTCMLCPFAKKFDDYRRIHSEQPGIEYKSTSTPNAPTHPVSALRMVMIDLVGLCRYKTYQDAVLSTLPYSSPVVPPRKRMTSHSRVSSRRSRTIRVGVPLPPARRRLSMRLDPCRREEEISRLYDVIANVAGRTHDVREYCMGPASRSNAQQ